MSIQSRESGGYLAICSRDMGCCSWDIDRCSWDMGRCSNLKLSVIVFPNEENNVILAAIQQYTKPLLFLTFQIRAMAGICQANQQSCNARPSIFQLKFVSWLCSVSKKAGTQEAQLELAAANYTLVRELVANKTRTPTPLWVTTLIR